MERIDLNEGSVAFIIAQVALLNCRVIGMQAENTHRLACGESIAYGEASFYNVEKEFTAMIGCNEILNMARK